MGEPRFVVIRLPLRRLAFLGVLFLVLAAGSTLRHRALPALAPSEALAGKRVAIDPGHGGVDPGAVGSRGTLEKDVVLSIALLLEPLLRRAGAETLLVRDTDRELASGAGPFGTRQRHDLTLRVNEANAFGADVYVSLHANSVPSPKWSGAQTFYDPEDGQSYALAVAIQERLVRAFPANHRRARPGDYFVLRHTRMPAVVVEVGFLSNPQEEERLKSLQHQRVVAEAVYLGIVDYFAAGEGGRDAPGVEAVALPASAGARPGPGEFLLYFPSDSDGNEGLVPVVERFPEHLVDAGGEEKLSYALKRLLGGPPAASTLLPVAPPGTKLLGAKLDEGRLHVDLSREVASRSWGGGRGEALLLESLLLTVGQFPGVSEVALSVEGERKRTLAGHLDLAEPFAVPTARR